MQMLSLVALSGFVFLLAILFGLVFKLIILNKKIESTKNKKNKFKERKNKKSLNEDRKTQQLALNENEQFSCAFFHPNCSAGGGGERTLWSAIISIKLKFPKAKLAIYIKSGIKNQETIAEIKQKALDDFNLEIPDDLKLIPLKTIFLGESQFWPRLTLLGQIFGSLVIGIESMIKYRPYILIDTSGFPFIYPIIKLFNCKLISYVHYPFISTDMINNLQMKSFNNSDFIVNNRILRIIKIQYYRILLKFYSLSGNCCDLALTNSSWTYGHILKLWKGCQEIKILFPPCDLSPFKSINRDFIDNDQGQVIISLSQFRPEKNHKLQLEIAAEVLKKLSNVKFIFIGGCRGIEDEERVTGLKKYAESLGILKSVDFRLNLSFDDLLENIKMATIGLHTMSEEHFGIGIVELMAGGLITIANNSGGPRTDIIKPQTENLNLNGTGFLCNSTSEYSQTILKISSMTKNERMKIVSRARKDVLDRFSGEIFCKSFAKFVNEIVICK